MVCSPGLKCYVLFLIDPDRYVFTEQPIWNKIFLLNVAPFKFKFVQIWFRRFLTDVLKKKASEANLAA
jgi:hypothetical protein